MYVSPSGERLALSFQNITSLQVILVSRPENLPRASWLSHLKSPEFCSSNWRSEASSVFEEFPYQRNFEWNFVLADARQWLNQRKILSRLIGGSELDGIARRDLKLKNERGGICPARGQ
jgi:hypothetical protein